MANPRRRRGNRCDGCVREGKRESDERKEEGEAPIKDADRSKIE